MALFLEYIDASVTPPLLCPNASSTLTATNCKDPSKDITFSFDHHYSNDTFPAFGAFDFLPVTDASVESGCLSSDGSLLLRVDIWSVCSQWAKKRQVQAPEHPVTAGMTLGGDLLALLDEPGGSTADFTIDAGGRSFRVHRAVLAARCPYFATLFASTFYDSAAKELALEGANADALRLLLRYLYGGVLDSCARELLMPAVALADRLLLPPVHSMLRQRLVSTATHETVVADLLWAEQRGDQPLLADLENEYLDRVDSIKDESVELLAQYNPQLMVRLHKALAGRLKRQRTC